MACYSPESVNPLRMSPDSFVKMGIPRHRGSHFDQPTCCSRGDSTDLGILSYLRFNKTRPPIHLIRTK